MAADDDISPLGQLSAPLWLPSRCGGGDDHNDGGGGDDDSNGGGDDGVGVSDDCYDGIDDIDTGYGWRHRMVTRCAGSVTPCRHSWGRPHSEQPSWRKNVSRQCEGQVRVCSSSMRLR